MNELDLYTFLIGLLLGIAYLLGSRWSNVCYKSVGIFETMVWSNFDRNL